jgi:Tfp pilus assembly protein FimV
VADANEEPPYIYEVKKNDRLLDIIAEYNDYFQKHGQAKVTMAQVLKANPGLKADRLVAGSKVRIPVPPKDSK